MLNEIMKAVTNRLEELFGEDYAIYTSSVEQGLEEPCFFVGFLEPSERPLIGSRYFRNSSIYIQFLSDKEGLKLTTEVNEVADMLISGMEYIALSDGRKIEGTQRKCKIADGVLNFFVSYNTFGVKERPEAEPIERLEVKGAIK